MKVKNIISKRTGKAIPNQFIIASAGKVYFQSYKSIISYVDENGKIYVDNDETGINLKQGTLFTRTTCKQLRVFMADELHMEPQAKETIFQWLARLEKEGKVIRVNLNA